MDNDSSTPKTATFDEVEKCCRSFAAQTRGNRAPEIKEQFHQVSADARPTLLRNLLHNVVQNRRARGEQPTSDEFISHFPEHASLVRQVIYESSTLFTRAPVTRSHWESDFAAAAGAAEQAPGVAANHLGEYLLLGELGQGGMGTVVKAVHTKHGHQVALKTRPVVSGDRLHAFKREFRSMAGINHLNLIGLQTLEADGPYWFLTMELIDGSDFISYVRPQEKLDESRLRAALMQLVAGVLALHGQHIIHRDLEPSNVMVDGKGRVKILDFGLVFEEVGLAVDDERRVAGTPAYMAPEQAAGEKITGAADWYAVGVMLYEALSGRRPFLGKPMDVLRIKQTQEPSPLNDPDLPKDLAGLCLQLLARSPTERPDSIPRRYGSADRRSSLANVA